MEGPWEGTMKNRIWRRIAVTVATTLLAAASFSQALSLYQMSYDLDGTVTNFTGYGRADLTYTGASSMLYMNMSVNGQWQVLNRPVLSPEGTGNTNQVSLYFDLGVVGVPVSNVNYGFTLTTTPMGAPSSSLFGAVAQDTDRINHGSIGFSLGGPLLPAIPSFTNGAGANTQRVSHAGFPNQPCGSNQCAPTAISNSLQWLNSTYMLGITPGDLSINNMLTACGWTTDGCNIFGPNAFWRLKDQYVRAHGWPISTRILTSFADIYAELKNGQDVELEMMGHTAAVVGMTDLGGGKYGVDIAHDPKQRNNANDPRVDNLVFNTNTGTFIDGPAWSKGRGINYAVIECPVPEPGTIIALTFGIASLAARRRHRRK